LIVKADTEAWRINVGLYIANRDPLWLVLEEADAFAPQQSMGDMTRVLGEVDRLARRSRGLGLG